LCNTAAARINQLGFNITNIKYKAAFGYYNSSYEDNNNANVGGWLSTVHTQFPFLVEVAVVSTSDLTFNLIYCEGINGSPKQYSFLQGDELIWISKSGKHLQHYLQTREDRGLYSANKQQADRYYKIIKKTTKYPLSIRNDLIRLEHDPSNIAEYWVRIPVKLVKGGLWIGLIKPYEPIPKDAKICECKLYKRDNRWFLDVVVQRDIPEKTEYQNVIAIDMGIKHIATSVELATNRTVFYGKDLNLVRGWYFWLRRQLGLKKAIDTIKKIGHHEKRIANDIVHKITTEIVNRAIETNSLIVLGALLHKLLSYLSGLVDQATFS
jgi:transposase